MPRTAELGYHLMSLSIFGELFDTNLNGTPSGTPKRTLNGTPKETLNEYQRGLELGIVLFFAMRHEFPT